MFEEFPEALTRATIAAFLSGWVVAKVAGYIGRKLKARNQDPRDVRIRSLEADVRVAHTAAEKSKAKLEEGAAELTEIRKALKERDGAISRQERTIDQLRGDLRDSVKKTRELREELAQRATENVRSELKLREVETELSVVQASTDLLATGMLDFMTPDGEEEDVQVFKAGGSRNL
jgi:chromosome segregation ATPase